MNVLNLSLQSAEKQRLYFLFLFFLIIQKGKVQTTENNAKIRGYRNGSISCRSLSDKAMAEEMQELLLAKNRSRLKPLGRVQRIQYQFTSRTIKTMNYVAMMPNAFSNNAFRPQALFTNPVGTAMTVFQTNVLLNTLSKALNFSLKNFQEKCYPTVSNTQKSSSITHSSRLSSDNCPKRESVRQGEETHKENLKNQMEVENPQQTLQNSNTAQKSNQARQPHTDDEIHLDSKESSSVRKDVCSTKKNKKNRREEKVDDFVVMIPQVDLNDCAYIPSMGIASKTLAQKKEELMQRRITDCNDFIKGRKEKREIRMLGN